MEKYLKDHFEAYPEHVRARLFFLRTSIFNIAETLALGEVKESLKWGEPSYVVKSGSPIRIDWKHRSPENYYVFFNCQTKLVATYKELYGDILTFQGNRAISISLSETMPETIINHCLEIAMTYKRRKHLPLLGE